VLLSADDLAIRHLVNIFSGLEKRYEGTVEIDRRNILYHWKYCRKQLVYLSSSSQWPPDLKTGVIISFFRKNTNLSEDEFEDLFIKLNLDDIFHRPISELEEVQRRNIFFSLARLKKCHNYIIHDLARGMPLEFNLEFKKSLQQLKQEGCSILYLSDDVFLAPEIGDRIGFMKKGKLLLELKAAKMKKMDLKELYFQFLAEQ